MSLRRRQLLQEPVALAARQLKRYESQIALLDRVRPLNLQAERSRLVAACSSGAPALPEFQYAAPAQLHVLRKNLETLAGALPPSQLEPRLLGERAAELELEAALAESVGKSEFWALAARRFALPTERQLCHDVALSWSRSASNSEPDAKLHLSDDKHDPESLWSQLVQRLESERLPVRVEITAGLVALAAVADGIVRVRAGARLSAAVARRIALHEVEGHIKPRLAGQLLGGVLLAGSAGATEDEEGRAILLEERAGLLGAGRRAELGLRYLAAESVRDSADFRQTVQLLLEHGAHVEAAVELSCRVHRGGGLGRELSYLMGYRRVAGALGERPELEGVTSSGRVSLAAAAELLDAGSVELDDDRNVV